MYIRKLQAKRGIICIVLCFFPAVHFFLGFEKRIPLLLYIYRRKKVFLLIKKKVEKVKEEA